MLINEPVPELSAVIVPSTFVLTDFVQSRALVPIPSGTASPIAPLLTSITRFFVVLM